jgi:hypothetical protein
MQTLTIPVIDSPNWRQRTPLDDGEYLLDFFWNDRAGAWFLSISDVEGNTLAASIKLVCNTPLIYKKRWDVRMPRGELVCFDPTRLIDAPGRYDLNSRVQFIYLDADSLTELEALT